MTTPRRFRLSDAIILVAATAVGLFVVRPYSAVASLITDLGRPLSASAPLDRRMVLVRMEIFKRSRSRSRWRGPLRSLVSGCTPVGQAGTQPRPAARIRCRVDGQSHSGGPSVRIRDDVFPRSRSTRLFMYFTRAAQAAAEPRWVCRPAVSISELDHILTTMAPSLGVSVGASWVWLLATGAWRPKHSLD